MIKLDIKNLSNKTSSESIEFNKEDETIIMMVKQLNPANNEYMYTTYSISLEDFMPVVQMALDEPFLQKKVVGFGQLELF